MSGSYPLGVSGREPQIAGYPEREEARLVSCKVDEDEGCRFEGTVVVTLYQIGFDEVEVQWDCPLCKRQNIEFEASDDGPDPDDQRDRANDERGN